MSKIAQAGTLAPELLASVKIYINTKHYRECDAGKILQETGGDFLIGGPIFLWDKSKKPYLPKGPCCHLKADGEVLCAPDYVALLRLGSGGMFCCQINGYIQFFLSELEYTRIAVDI